MAKFIVIFLCLSIITLIRIPMVNAQQSDQLVDIAKLDSTIILDIRYATPNNFTGKAIYTEAKAYLVAPAAKALVEVQKELKKRGLGLKIYDAYRPLSAQWKLWKIKPDPNYVADPRHGSRHNRGAAVDVTLVDSTGKELPMPTPFDSFSEKAHSNYMDLPDSVIRNRTLLQDVMKKYGFIPLDTEWWHFDYKGWKKYPILDINFEDIKE